MERLTRFLRSTIPDPFVVALGLTLIAFVPAVLWGGGPMPALEAWAAGPLGMWSLLNFSMQMCLILVTGFVVARTPPVAWAVGQLADRMQTSGKAAVAIAVVAMVLGLVHWGLGLVVGALLAREVGDRLAARGVPAERGLLAAAGYTGLCVWHGGFSGSAPLKLTREADVIEVLGAAFVRENGVIPLDQTVLSMSNLVVNGVLLVVLPLTLWALSGRDDTVDRRVSDTDAETEEATPGVAGALERGPWLSLPVGVLLLAFAAHWLRTDGLSTLDPNTLNGIALGVGLVLAGSPKAFGSHLHGAAAACAGIIIQFPLYAGIRGLLVHAGLVEGLAAILPSSETMLALAAFASAGAFNLLVPSGGGQWSVQGPVLMEAALEVGADPARIVRAFAYGDQWTNLIQPFWALPLLGITGTRASDVLSYTLVLLVVTGTVFAVGVVL